LVDISKQFPYVLDGIVLTVLCPISEEHILVHSIIVIGCNLLAVNLD